MGETSLLMVGLHEIGHALGLGHSLSGDSVMQPIYKGYSEPNLKLGKGDIKAISTLYGKKRIHLKKDDMGLGAKNLSNMLRYIFLERKSIREDASVSGNVKNTVCQRIYNVTAYAPPRGYIFVSRLIASRH